MAYEINVEELVKLTKKALAASHSVLESIGKEGAEEVHDAHVTDISTEGDMAVSRSLIELFKKEKIPCILYSEESGKIDIGETPQIMITFDDIDGTDNYHRSKKHGGKLPHCTVVTILDSLKPKFRNVLIAGIIDHITGNIWHAIRGKGTFLNDKEVNTSGSCKINRRTLIIVDSYLFQGNIGKLENIYTNSWVKDFGSSAFHLAGISSGLFDGYLNNAQKAHEIGAGFLLVKEAGGFTSDWKGNSIDDVGYDFNKTYHVVSGATKDLVQDILSRIISE